MLIDIWKRRAAIPFSLGGLVILFFLPTIFGRRTFPRGDFTALYLPYNIFFRNALAAWRLPVWNPYSYSGHPFLADPQSAVFYPLNALVTLLSSSWTTLAGRYYWLQIEAIAHFFLAGLFTYLLVRTLSGEKRAGLMGATVFMFSGYLTGYPALQLTILRTAIWLPLLLWLLLQAFRELPRWRWWILFALTYAIAYFAGHPQTFIYLSYVTFFWGLTLAVTRLRQTGFTLATVAQIILYSMMAFSLFLGLIAIQFLPSIEFVRLSVRARVDYEFLSGGATTMDFWQFLLPSVWSNFSPFYVGIIGSFLALFSIVGVIMAGVWGFNPREKNRNLMLASLFFAVVGLVALLVGMGRNGPLYDIFYRFAPGWKLFRNQERAAYVVTLSLSVLTGLGVTWIGYIPLRLRKGTSLGLTSLLFAGIVAFFLVWRIPLRLAIADREFTTTILLTLLSLGIAAIVIWKSPKRTGWLIPLNIIALFYANWDTLQVPVALEQAASLPAPLAAVKAANEDCSSVAAPCAPIRQSIPGRMHNESHVENGLGPSIALEETWGASPLRLQRYAALFDNFPLDKMWRLTATEHVLTWRAELFEPATLLGRFVDGEDSVYLYRLAEVNPRAWFVEEVRIMEDQRALQAIAESEIDLETQAILPPDALNVKPAIPSTVNSNDAPIMFTRTASNKLQIYIPSGGMLILSENWMPGWRATLRSGKESDAHGISLPVVRADVTLLGIIAPEDGGRIELVYWPTSVQLGLFISISTLLVMLLGASAVWLHSR